MPEMAAKIAQERQAGRPASSDVYLGPETQIATLIETDTLEAVDWAGWAPNLRDPRLLAPDGVAVQVYSRVPGITYNTNQLRGDAIPRALPDVLKPQYKGRIASTPYAANFDRLASPELWGEARAHEFVTKLADQVAGLLRCGESERLLSGEFDMLVTDCGSYEAHRLRAQGAPIGHVIPADAAILAYFYMGVPRNAAHPNAAKLFVNYLLSRHGQDVLYEADFVDHYLLPGSKSAREVEFAQANGVRFTEIDVAFVQRHDIREVNRIRNEFQRILNKN